MSEPKPIASLSSTLLARKGHAKPAMRPQGFTNFGFGAPPVTEDLGWNDMGEPAPQPVAPVETRPVEARTADIVPIAPSAPVAVAPVETPVVHRQQEEIAREMAPIAPAAPVEPVVEPAIESRVEAAVEPEVGPVVEAAAETGERRRDDRTRNAVAVEIERSVTPRAMRGSKSKAAFTLRLDAERHLKLRLAGAVAHRSSQAIVIDALDAYLETLPRVAELARDASLRSNAAHDTQTEDKR